MIATLEAETQKKRAKKAKKPGNRSRFKHHRRGWSHGWHWSRWTILSNYANR